MSSTFVFDRSVRIGPDFGLILVRQCSQTKVFVETRILLLVGSLHSLYRESTQRCYSKHIHSARYAYK